MSHSLRSLSSDLRAILSDSVIVPSDNCGNFDLIETERSQIMTVRITAPLLDIAAIRLEKFSHSSFLQGSNVRRRADYLLICQQDCIIHAVIIELKPTLENPERYRQQLRRSLPILHYLRSVCEIHYEHGYDDSSLAVHYIVIAEKEANRFDKQPVRVGPSKWPERESYKNIDILRYVGLDFSFNHLTSICATP